MNSEIPTNYEEKQRIGENEKKYKKNIYSYSFHYFNFSYFPSEMEHKIVFYYACQYDYIDIVEYFIQTKQIDIKEKIIFNLIWSL